MLLVWLLTCSCVWMEPDIVSAVWLPKGVYNILNEGRQLQATHNSMKCGYVYSVIFHPGNLPQDHRTDTESKHLFKFKRAIKFPTFET